MKGYPLRTTFYMAFGGPHCGKAKQAQQQQASSGGGLGMHGLASKAIAGGFAGLFHRGAAAIHADSVGGAAVSGAANEAAEPAAGAAADAVAPQSSSPGAASTAAPASGALVRVVSLTTETTSIDTSSIPSDQFDIPADWTRQPQQQVKGVAHKCPTETAD